MELSDLVKRAWKDAEFKRALLGDPRTTIEEALGVTLPAGTASSMSTNRPRPTYI